MPKTYNEEWLDALIRHQVYLLRRRAALQRETAEILGVTTAAVISLIRDRMAEVRGMTPGNVRSANATARAAIRLREKAWKKVEKLWSTWLGDLARDEPRFLAGALRTVSPTQLELDDSSDVDPAVIPFEGRTYREWLAALEAGDSRRIRDAIIIGLSQDLTSPGIARGVESAMATSLRFAASTGATAFIAIADAGKTRFTTTNIEFFQEGEELYVATLDSRTTPICRSLDGKIFKVGEGPHPPLHFYCRSLRIAMLNGEAISMRPARNFTEKQLLREYAAREGLVGRVTSRGQLPYGHKGSYDKFARRRMRQLTGRVPGKVTYQKWLEGQSATFQDDILGPTRGRLFRRGELTLDKFVDRKDFELIPLDELVTRERQAFIKAGLDPGEFLQ